MLEAHGIRCLRADNPGLFTLQGTNTWVLDGGWVIDPGPALDAHLDAIVAALDAPLQGIALTHHHRDHVEAVPALLERCGAAPVAAADWPGADVRLADGDAFGPLRALATPGHADDHLAFLLRDEVLFAGDLVLGEGSVILDPDPGALSAYLRSLERVRALPLRLLCPGHGPLVEAPAAKLDEYLAHRAERERLLLEAFAAGARDEAALLDHAWSDVPPELRPAAAVTLRSHLGKLSQEGRVPDDVHVPELRLPPDLHP